MSKYLSMAEYYYIAMGNKNLAAIEQLLHPEVHFISPFMELTGKDKVLKSIEGFMQAFDNLTIRAKFSSNEQAVIIYNVECLAPIGLVRSSALMSFKDDLLVGIELFFDTKAFRKI